MSQEQISGEGFPLSPQQRRLWALGAGSQGSAFEARADVRITGAVNREALLASVRDVVARHEILRTAFHTAADMTEPLQVIADAPSTAPVLVVATSETELRLTVTLPSLCCDRRGLDNLIADVRAA